MGEKVVFRAVGVGKRYSMLSAIIIIGSPIFATVLSGEGEIAAPAVFGRILLSDTFAERPAAPPSRAAVTFSVVHAVEFKDVVGERARSNSASFSLRLGLCLWDFDRPRSLSIASLLFETCCKGMD